MDAKDTKQLSVEQQAIVDAISTNIALTQKAVLSAPEAAAYMNVSLSHLYKLTMQRKVPFSKPLGKICYFSRLELEAWLMSNRVATADELQDRAQAYSAHARTNNNRKGGAK